VHTLLRGIEFRRLLPLCPAASKTSSRINLRIAPEERIALVGTNGRQNHPCKASRSLYEPTAGRIYLDGVDLRELEPTDLREKIGIIFQDFTSMNDGEKERGHGTHRTAR